MEKEKAVNIYTTGPKINSDCQQARKSESFLLKLLYLAFGKFVALTRLLFFYFFWWLIFISETLKLVLTGWGLYHQEVTVISVHTQCDSKVLLPSNFQLVM